MSREDCVLAMANAAQIPVRDASVALDAAEPWIREREREAFYKGVENVTDAARDEDDVS